MRYCEAVRLGPLHLWAGVCFGVIVVLSGCATRGSVKRLQSDVAALQTKVEGTNRELAQMGAVLRESQTRIGEHSRGIESLGQRAERLERLDARLQEFEKALRDMKASVDALRAPAARAPDGAPAESADKVYTSGHLQYQTGNFGQAVLEFTDLLQRFPRDPLAENAQYWIAAAYLSHHDYRQALTEFRKVLDQYPGGRKTPDALYQVGVCYRNLFEPQRAREVWQQLIRQHPQSDAARLARTAMRATGAARGK